MKLDMPPQQSWGGIREADGGVMSIALKPMTRPALRATSPSYDDEEET
jgi:hypothetical protein